MSDKVPSHKKRIDESYRWKNSAIVDRHPELIAFLRTKPIYTDALYFRRSLLARLRWLNPKGSGRPQLDIGI